MIDLVAGPADVFPEAVLGADAGIIEPRRDRVDVQGLAVLVLQDVAEAAVQDAGPALGKAGGVLAGLEPAPARLGADQRDLGIVDERGEHPRRVGTAADAGHHASGSRPIWSRHWALVSRPITD